MLPASPLTALEAGRGSGSGTFPTVQPTTPIRHCRALAARRSSRLRAAARSLGEVTRRIPIFQPTAPLFTGYIANFFVASHHATPLRACPRQSPAHRSRRWPRQLKKRTPFIIWTFNLSICFWDSSRTKSRFRLRFCLRDRYGLQACAGGCQGGRMASNGAPKAASGRDRRRTIGCRLQPMVSPQGSR